MRRLTVAAAVCGTLVLAACNDQRPTEPVVPPPSENLGSCRPTPFPLTGANGIAQQIANIYPGTSKAQTLLRAQALAQAGAIKLLWDTCHPDAARKAAFIFIDWLNRHTPVGKETQVQNLIISVLRGVGEITGAPADGDFGVGFFDPANPNPTVITTINHHALVQLDPASFLVPTEIVISRKAGDPPLTNFDGRQFPPTYDYNAINSTNTHVLQPGKTAVVAFCLVELGDTEIPNSGYPPNLRIGHNPVAGAPGFPFEILEPFDLEGTELRNDLNCPGQPLPPPIGSAGGGLQDLASAVFQTAGGFLLPEPLWAAALGKIPPPPPLGGKAGSLSPFKPVEFSDNQLNILTQPSDHTSDRNYFVGGSIRPCTNPPPGPGDGCQDLQVQMEDGEGTPVGAGTVVTASLIKVNAPAGTTPVLGGDNTQPIATIISGDNTLAGAATFNDLEIDQPGRYQLKFEAPGAAPVTSEEFDVYKFDFTLQPTADAEGTVTEGEFLGETDPDFDNPVVRVSLLDYQGNVVTGASDPIIVILPIDPLILNGDTHIDAVNGVANFTEISDVQTGLTATIFEGCAGGAPNRRGALLAWSRDADQIQSQHFNVVPVCPL